MQNASLLNSWDDVLPQGRLWLFQASSDVLAAKSIKAQDVSFRRFVRQSLETNFPNFSHWSHASRWPYVAVGASKYPFGLDIESAKIHQEAWPLGMLTEDEQAWLRDFPQQDQQHWFGRLWSAKESFVKAIGVGFACAPEVVIVTWLSSGDFEARHAELGVLGRGSSFFVCHHIVSFCSLLQS